MKKIIIAYALTPQEHLEVLPDRNKVSLFIALKIIVKKIWRNIYDFIQRKFSSPKSRKLLINFEKFFCQKNTYILSSKEKIELEKFKRDEIIFFKNLDKNINFNYIFEKISNEEKLYSAYQQNEMYLKKNRKDEILMGYIEAKSLLRNEEILKLINNEQIIKIAELKLGTRAIFDNIWCWWSFKNNSAALGPQNFHRDYNSINFVKLFVYLTDVDKNSGPHVFVKNSSKKNVFKNIGRYNDNEVKKEFENNIISIEGKKYTTFMANTFCLHKGLPPSTKDRLLLCVLYSTNPSRAAPKYPPFNYDDYSIKDCLIKNKYLNQFYFH